MHYSPHPPGPLLPQEEKGEPPQRFRSAMRSEAPLPSEGAGFGVRGMGGWTEKTYPQKGAGVRADAAEVLTLIRMTDAPAGMSLHPAACHTARGSVNVNVLPAPGPGLAAVSSPPIAQAR